VNLYIPSELSWHEAGMVLRQQGDITRCDAVRLTVVKAGARAAIPALAANTAGGISYQFLHIDANPPGKC